MNRDTIQKLSELNRDFYESFGKAFAATRQRIQPGVRRFLDEDCFDGDWLDLGCGSGALAAAWAESGRTGSYTGVDFSQTLLEEARRLNENISDSRMKLSFFQADLSDSSWVRLFENRKFDGICAFAVLHHMPDASARSRIFRQVYSLLKPDGCFCYSVWQFQNSEKMMRRILPWESIGIQSDDVEPGDTLLDWRFSLPDADKKIGLRYVHLFTDGELQSLAEEAGFLLRKEYFSDGTSRNLALYRIEQRKV